MKIEPYVFFEGTAEEAGRFYQKAIGAEQIMLMRNSEAPEGGMGADKGDKIMHMALKIGDTLLMGSDGYATGKPAFQGFALSLTADNDAEAKRFFDALSEGGKVTQPIIKTFFSSSFGMLTDKFGVSWMITV